MSDDYIPPHVLEGEIAALKARVENAKSEIMDRDIKIGNLLAKVEELEVENDKLRKGHGIEIVYRNNDVCGEEFSGTWQGFDDDKGATVGLNNKDGSPALMLRIPDIEDSSDT